jgi:general secretion pathway protein G
MDQDHDGARERARGFTLTEVIVTMVIVAVLGALLIPTVFVRTKVARADAIVAELSNLESAIYLYRNDVGRYPGRLDYLNKLPSGTLVDACGNNLSAGNQAKFRGPYISRPIVLLNELSLPWYVLATGDSVNGFLNFLPNFQGQRVFQIEVAGPELDVAKIIDAKVDGVEGDNAGKLQYSDNGGAGTNAGMEKLLTYTIPVRAGAC